MLESHIAVSGCHYEEGVWKEEGNFEGVAMGESSASGKGPVQNRLRNSQAQGKM